MTDFEKALSHLSDQVKRYRQMEILEGNELNEILQQVTGTLFFLEKQRAEYHDQWQRHVHRLVQNGESVNKSENSAHVAIPEMYLCRKVMDAGYTVAEAIRSNLSWLKTEINNSK
jgi:tryptophan 2,3-dioxygenase